MDSRTVKQLEALRISLQEKCEQYYLQTHRWEEEHNAYTQELREQECIRLGDFDALQRVKKDIQAGAYGLVEEKARYKKDMMITVIAISSRSAIRGGVPSELAFSMCDYYYRYIESTEDWEVLKRIAGWAQEDFCRQVRLHEVNTDTGILITRCRNIVERQMRGPLRVADIAKQLGVSATYLSTLFSTSTGITLKRYIQKKRCYEAARMLMLTEESYHEIAASLGFSSQSHFGQVFREWMGMTPDQYRKYYNHVYTGKGDKSGKSDNKD